mmetsp:Transcript_44485/g.43151  ORF Transcript_44485/g.43151 Transcript_44485/m.43151 type:complete len:289 (+) Transcript_44485:9-875(+)
MESNPPKKEENNPPPEEEMIKGGAAKKQPKTISDILDEMKIQAIDKDDSKKPPAPKEEAKVKKIDQEEEDEEEKKEDLDDDLDSLPSTLQVREENDIRIAVIGNVDSGKSTLVGVLTKGIMDDGRGAARMKVFNYSHEAANGRTSSIGQEIMGFSEDQKQVELERANATKNQAWNHIASNSKKLITFLDLCGHEKYLKTTMFGLVGLLPDYSMIIVGANMGVSRMTKEHLGISLALKVPIFIVITKVDICPPTVYDETKETLVKILKSPGCQRMPVIIKPDDDVSVFA